MADVLFRVRSAYVRDLCLRPLGPFREFLADLSAKGRYQEIQNQVFLNGVSPEEWSDREERRDQKGSGGHVPARRWIAVIVSQRANQFILIVPFRHFLPFLWLNSRLSKRGRINVARNAELNLYTGNRVPDPPEIPAGKADRRTRRNLAGRGSPDRLPRLFSRCQVTSMNSRANFSDGKP